MDVEEYENCFGFEFKVIMDGSDKERLIKGENGDGGNGEDDDGVDDDEVMLGDKIVVDVNDAAGVGT